MLDRLRIIFAAAVAFALGRLIGSEVFGIKDTENLLAFSGAFMVGAALLVSWRQVRRRDADEC